jgi:hypothetical protein
MPTYTYRCPEGHEWDEIRSIEGSEASEAPCPVCMEATTGPAGLQPGQSIPTVGRKVPSTFSVSFKGRGWTPTFYPNTRGNK